MQIHNDTPFVFSLVPGRMNFPDHSLTIVCKGTFCLGHGGLAETAIEQLQSTADQPFDADHHATTAAPGATAGTAELRYEADSAPFKPRTDLLLVAAQTTREATPERPWTFAVGDQQHSGASLAEFAPQPRDLPPRADLRGRYDDAWLETRWPWFAEDFDFGFFNAARTELQIDDYLSGDEEISLQNFFTERPDYRCRLPGLRVRGFVLRDAVPGAGDQGFREVPMHLDTLWIDADRELLVLVWRGWTPVQGAHDDGLSHLWLRTEPIEADQIATEDYEAQLRGDLKETKRAQGPTQAEQVAWIQDESTEDEAVLEAALAYQRQVLIDRGLDPDDLPPPSHEQQAAEACLLRELGFDADDDAIPLDRAGVLQRLRHGPSLANEDLSGLDLSTLDLSDADLRGVILTGANLEDANLSGADLTGARLSGARLNRARLRGTRLFEADLRSAQLSLVDLTGAVLERASLDDAQLDQATLIDVRGERLSAVGARLTGVNASGSHLPRANLANARLEGSDFSDANLRDARLESVSGRGLCAARADLTGARAADGADFSQSDFTHILGDGSIWEGARLDGAIFRGAQLRGADFSAASLRQADLCTAVAREARFQGAYLVDTRLLDTDLFEADFEGAHLDGADLSGSNCYAAEFLDASLNGLKSRDTNLKRTKLAAPELGP